MCLPRCLHGRTRDECFYAAVLLFVVLFLGGVRGQRALDDFYMWRTAVSPCPCPSLRMFDAMLFYVYNPSWDLTPSSRHLISICLVQLC